MSLDIALIWKKGRKEFSENLNITHNAGRIAKRVPLRKVNGKQFTLYDVLWNHDDVKWSAGDIIKDLEAGLKYLSDNSGKLKRYETVVKEEFRLDRRGKISWEKLPPNKWYKWGSLEDTDEYGHRFGIIPFVEQLLVLCIKHPDATIEWSR